MKTLPYKNLEGFSTFTNIGRLSEKQKIAYCYVGNLRSILAFEGNAIATKTEMMATNDASSEPWFQFPPKRQPHSNDADVTRQEGDRKKMESGDLSSEVLPPHPAKPQIHFFGLAMVFLCPALGGFLYGYDIGATSFVLAMLRETQDQSVWWFGISDFEQGLVVSSQALGALLGSHIVLVYLASSVGRRKEIRIAAVLYIVGILCNVVAGTIFKSSDLYLFGGTSWGLATLVFGRLLFGAGVGFVMHGVSFPSEDQRSDCTSNLLIFYP